MSVARLRVVLILLMLLGVVACGGSDSRDGAGSGIYANRSVEPNDASDLFVAGYLAGRANADEAPRQADAGAFGAILTDELREAIRKDFVRRLHENFADEFDHDAIAERVEAGEADARYQAERERLGLPADNLAASTTALFATGLGIVNDQRVEAPQIAAILNQVAANLDTGLAPQDLAIRSYALELFAGVWLDEADRRRLAGDPVAMVRLQEAVRSDFRRLNRNDLRNVIVTASEGLVERD